MFVFVTKEAKHLALAHWLCIYLHTNAKFRGSRLEGNFYNGINFNSINISFISIISFIHKYRRWIKQGETTNTHITHSTHSQRLIQLIWKCLDACVNVKIWCFTLWARSKYKVTIFFVPMEWLSTNDSRETNINIQNPFDIVFRCIWHHDSSQRAK